MLYDSKAVSSRTIKTIIFDLGNVLIPVNNQFLYRGIARICGRQPEDVSEVMKASGLWQSFEQGQVSSEALFQKMKHLFPMGIGFDEFCNLWCSSLLPGVLIPEKRLDALRLNYRLLILSNTNCIHLDAIRKSYTVLRHFDCCVFSFLVGAMKPASEIFHQALLYAGCPPSQCLFIDDTLQHVIAARQLGIQAVQFHSWTQLEADLMGRQIKMPWSGQPADLSIEYRREQVL